MNTIEKITKIPKWQKARYLLMILSCALFFAPFLFIPGLFDVADFCAKLCPRRFYLYFPGMGPEDLTLQMQVSIGGVILLSGILLVTFFFGRLWCSFICPVGAFPELISRLLNNRIKIEYRALPQVAIRYGYFGFFLVMMPMLGISACVLCNFMTVPRIFQAIAGKESATAFFLSSIGIVNLALVILLGFFASKGRAYCAFLCPVGAIDGLVNRISASFKFTRHIRVERDRCVGCTVCVQACMCGAIEMVGNKTVIDQLSCMSCHECVDVCNRGAIEYLSIPPETRRHRKKRDEVLPPLPEWTTISSPAPGSGIKGVRWQRVVLGVVTGMVALFIVATQVDAKVRKMDPDGCFACHSFKGLDYIDKDGLLRSATIDESHYYSSLHGSVPCKDCHRKIKEYPHDVKNGVVDCADSCHVKEPSKGEKYSHKKVVKEFKGSAHGSGSTKDLTGGNRLKELKSMQNPSCRRCHSNTLYIEEEMMPKFKETFVDCDRECGTCHPGKAWMGQFGGHVLRRLLGGRWTKKLGNELCNDCHDDLEKMNLVEIEEKEGTKKKKKKAGPRFIMATKSYDMTLHSKMVMIEDKLGASCINCHAPIGTGHDIRRDDDVRASTHKDRLTLTCGAKKCHPYASSPLNAGFIGTDMHSLDLVSSDVDIAPIDKSRFSSNWVRWGAFFMVLSLLMAVVSFFWILIAKKKGKIWPAIGGNSFQKRMLKRAPKKRSKKKVKKKEDA